MPQAAKYIFIRKSAFLHALDVMAEQVHPIYHTDLRRLQHDIAIHDRTPDETRQQIAAKFKLWCNHSMPCAGCGAQMFMFATGKRSLAPFTDQGISHFADCPRGMEFRKDRKRQGTFKNETRYH